MRRQQAVKFALNCTEPRAWLVLTCVNQKPRVLEMREEDSGEWTATANLMPGEYRGRYYAGDNRNVTYFGAADLSGSTPIGMDSLITINQPTAQTVPSACN